MKYILGSLLAYLFGSIPWALVIGKGFYDIDVREHGSGNLGGTNAARTLGKKAGILVIILDALKAFIPVLILKNFDHNLAILTGMFASVGHCYPVFANFKGGKAVATNFGYIIAISSLINQNFLIQALLPITIFLIIFYFTKMVSLSALIAQWSAVIISLTQANTLSFITILVVVTLSTIRHKENIIRIKNGTERKVDF